MKKLALVFALSAIYGGTTMIAMPHPQTKSVSKSPFKTFNKFEHETDEVHIVYTFNNNGTFTRVEKDINSGHTTKLNGKWEYSAADAMITCHYGNDGETFFVDGNNLIWEDPSGMGGDSATYTPVK